MGISYRYSEVYHEGRRAMVRGSHEGLVAAAPGRDRGGVS